MRANSWRYVCVLLAACVAAPVARVNADVPRPKIAYLLPTHVDEFQTESQKAIEVVLKELGYDVLTFDADDRPDLQARQLDAAIGLAPAAIVLNAVDYIKIGEGIAKANAAKIPVFVFDRQLRKGTVPAQVTFSSVPNAFTIGQRAADEAMRLLRLRYSDDIGRALVLQITGDPGDDYSLEIQRGFFSRVPAELRVKTRAAINWDPRNAGEIAKEEFAQAERNGAGFDLVFAHGADLLRPIIDLLKARKQKPTPKLADSDMAIKNPKVVLLIATNGAPAGLANIREGWQQVEVEQPVYAQVYGLAMAVRLMRAGELVQLREGACKILDVNGTIESGDLRPVLKLDGTVINSTNVGDKEAHFWGNSVPPAVAAKDVVCDP